MIENDNTMHATQIAVQLEELLAEETVNFKDNTDADEGARICLSDMIILPPENYCSEKIFPAHKGLVPLPKKMISKKVSFSKIKTINYNMSRIYHMINHFEKLYKPNTYLHARNILMIFSIIDSTGDLKNFHAECPKSLTDLSDILLCIADIKHGFSFEIYIDREDIFYYYEAMQYIEDQKISREDIVNALNLCKIFNKRRNNKKIGNRTAKKTDTKRNTNKITTRNEPFSRVLNFKLYLQKRSEISKINTSVSAQQQLYQLTNLFSSAGLTEVMECMKINKKRNKSKQKLSLTKIKIKVNEYKRACDEKVALAESIKNYTSDDKKEINSSNNQSFSIPTCRNKKLPAVTVSKKNVRSTEHQSIPASTDSQIPYFIPNLIFYPFHRKIRKQIVPQPCAGRSPVVAHVAGNLSKVDFSYINSVIQQIMRYEIQMNTINGTAHYEDGNQEIPAPKNEDSSDEWVDIEDHYESGDSESDQCPTIFIEYEQEDSKTIKNCDYGELDSDGYVSNALKVYRSHLGCFFLSPIGREHELNTIKYKQ